MTDKALTAQDSPRQAWILVDQAGNPTAPRLLYTSLGQALDCSSHGERAVLYEAAQGERGEVESAELTAMNERHRKALGLDDDEPFLCGAQRILRERDRYQDQLRAVEAELATERGIVEDYIDKLKRVEAERDILLAGMHIICGTHGNETSAPRPYAASVIESIAKLRSQSRPASPEAGRGERCPACDDTGLMGISRDRRVLCTWCDAKPSGQGELSGKVEPSAADEKGFAVGQRVRDRRGCCVGTVIVNDKDSKVGYTLVVDWDDGRRNTQHPDDLEPAEPSPPRSARAEARSDGEAQSAFSGYAYCCATCAQPPQPGMFGPTEADRPVMLSELYAALRNAERNTLDDATGEQIASVLRHLMTLLGYDWEAHDRPERTGKVQQ